MAEKDTTRAEIQKKAEEFIDELKKKWREQGLPCTGWDEEGKRKELIGVATQMILDAAGPTTDSSSFSRPSGPEDRSGY